MAVRTVRCQQSLASTKFGRYGSHFAVVWAIQVGIGRTCIKAPTHNKISGVWVWAYRKNGPGLIKSPY